MLVGVGITLFGIFLIPFSVETENDVPEINPIPIAILIGGLIFIGIIHNHYQKETAPGWLEGDFGGE